MAASTKPHRAIPLTVLGIDPGLRATGYGIVIAENGGYRAAGHGVFRPPPSSKPLASRLLAIRDAIAEIVERCHPGAVAIEEPYMGENAQSALALGRAQAAAMIAAAGCGLPVFTYAPARVKDAVAGYGRGDKEQIAAMVRIQLGMAERPEPADAADALAVALCHALAAQTRLVEAAR